MTQFTDSRGRCFLLRHCELQPNPGMRESTLSRVGASIGRSKTETYRSKSNVRAANRVFHAANASESHPLQEWLLPHEAFLLSARDFITLPPRRVARGRAATQHLEIIVCTAVLAR